MDATSENLTRGSAAPSAEAFWWSAGWGTVVVIGAVIMLARGGVGPDAAAILMLGGLPALVDVALSLAGRSSGGGLRLAAWALGPGLAMLLGGGALGPLGAWCLAPLAATLLDGRTRSAAAAGAVALGLLGLGLLVSLLGGTPAAAAAVPGSLTLQAVALVTTVGGLALGVVSLLRRIDHGERRGAIAQGRLQRLLAEQPTQLLDLLPDGRIAGAYGQPLAGADLAGRAFFDLGLPQCRHDLARGFQVALRDGRAELSFAPASDPDGWLEVRLRRGRSARMVAILADGRARRDQEAELEAARGEAEAQNTGKSRFLANMSHELRTPLNAIMGFSDIMRSRLFGPLPDRYGEYAELIHESGRHLLDLINDVLDMSKIEAERFELSREEFDGREAVNAVLRLMRGQADRAGVQLRGVLPREPLEIDADRRALKQIALNLVSNALKFTPRNGAVTVGLQAVGGLMELVVADTGMGMSPEDLARVGRPYEQAGDAERRAAGTGLGLSLVRSFAELHGGEMILESAVGEGTTVTVRMPVLLPPSAPSGAESAPRQEPAEAPVS
ncbi:HAMP domain-containing sensor histidine kinase [Phenylobacterium sp.]|jgi:cell cycle sensor histidine kinase DivJ|nr:HAMP domain-containing sensor histidine kinase [Phenylobacterium sp.]MAK83808.1 two-component sensor histidine kinase [Phenylobacterium sp.]|tara:strand:+ start:21834 stop:23507 length:1674 start_codon:yes stop_codon:yes gene_type:complete